PRRSGDRGRGDRGGFDRGPRCDRGPWCLAARRVRGRGRGGRARGRGAGRHPRAGAGVTGLVTGGAGFIGSTLVDRLLAEGHTVDVVDDLSSGNLANLADARRDGAGKMTFHRLDIRSADLAALVARREPEVVFHLAA